MKKRYGYVSNSSSASFIVTLNVSKEEFISIVNCSELCGVDSIEDRIKETVEIFKGSSCFASALDGKLKECDELNKYLEDIDNYPNWGTSKKFDFCKRVLEIFGLMVFPKDGNISLVDGTCMFNSYDNVPKLLKELIVISSFEHPGKIECKVIGE